MAKAFFEKLTCAGKEISTRESVINNVERILNFGGFLDAGVDGFSQRSFSRINGIYRNGLMAVVDQSLDNRGQIAQFQGEIVHVLKAFEPRIKDIQVLDIGHAGQRSRCQLKIQLVGGNFEQNFVFG